MQPTNNDEDGDEDEDEDEQAPLVHQHEDNIDLFADRLLNPEDYEEMIVLLLLHNLPQKIKILLYVWHTCSVVT